MRSHWFAPILLIAALAIAWYARYVLLLIFAGILVAIFLQTLSRWLADHSPLGYRPALALVVLLLVAAVLAAATLFGAQMVVQANQLYETLPTSVENVRQQIDNTDWGHFLLHRLSTGGDLFSNVDAVRHVTTTAVTFIDAVIGLVIVFFIGLYGAASPERYVNGVLHLVPLNKRSRANDVIRDVASTVRRWMLGHLTTMVIVGCLTGVGLSLVGIHEALILAALSFFAELIPYVGPIAAAIPGILIGWSQSSTMALYVLGVYCVIHVLEGYLIYPLVMGRAVELPPALTIVGIVFFSLFAGLLGAILATPLTLTVIVLVRLLYVHDYLGDKTAIIPHAPRRRKS
jgi:predicted PurR-regulated permease PerM